ncbi:hypothetical protein [Fictibacillus phosphorivorans]|uniref:hypothetical protein n=1 Tax=Fictibacillus phosphorivorans TaxID=1221500 RepID=UPI0011A229AE|nr:hypothetical protein [Fictibacillus phosphorivorans]
MGKYLIFLMALVILVLPHQGYAHSGRTDGSGGHNCSAKSQAKGLCTGYHYHNGGGSSGGSTPAPTPAPKPAPATRSDKDCSDFSNYDEVVAYWNAKGYSATNDPERLDGFGNVVDDGIPCEVPNGYDTAKINGSPKQIEQQDSAKGEKAGYQKGLADGTKGAEENDSSTGSAAFQSGYSTGYSKGYAEGMQKFEEQKVAVEREGYEVGKKHEKLVLPAKYQNNALLKQEYENGFNRALKEKEEAQIVSFQEKGFEDGTKDTKNTPKNVSQTLINAYLSGYEKGQNELREKYLKMGYNAAFTMITYKKPALKKEKYISWYKEGFKSNNEIGKIAEVAYEMGNNEEKYEVPQKYMKAETVYEYHYGLGKQAAQEADEANTMIFGLGVAAWLGRRFYVARKMVA